MVITTIRRPRLVHQSAELGSKRCREMRRTKIWASVRLSPFLAHLSMLSFIVSGCQTEGESLSKQPNYLKGNNIQSQPWSLVPLLIVQQPVEQTSKTRLFVCLCVVCLFVWLFVCVVLLCLFVCVFVSWLLVQCQPGEQTSISRCTAQVPSKRTKTSIARCLFSSFYFFELRFQEKNKEDSAAELNQRCWSM